MLGITQSTGSHPVKLSLHSLSKIADEFRKNRSSADENNSVIMSDELQFELYDFWFYSIKKNDVQAIERTLKITDEEQRRKLLNGKFVFAYSNYRNKTKRGVNFTRALSIAVSCRSFDVINSFIKYGVDPCVLDCEENNILHVLAYTAFTMPEEEDKVRDMYAFIQSIIPSDIILKLLKQTNSSGMRPSELAANLDAFGLFLDMFETPGLHLVEQSRNGINLTQWYDITEYESYMEGNRRFYCPMLFLLFLDKKALKYQGTHEVFKNELIKKWIDADFGTASPFLFLWFLCRITFAFLLFAFDGNALAIEEKYKLTIMNETVNDTCLSSMINSYKVNETGLFIMGAVILLYATAALVLDVIENVYFKCQGKDFYLFTPQGTKDLLAHFVFYRLIQLCLHLFAIALVIVKLGRIYGGLHIPFRVDNLIFTSLGLFNFWSYMQFAQVSSCFDDIT